MPTTKKKLASTLTTEQWQETHSNILSRYSNKIWIRLPIKKHNIPVFARFNVNMYKRKIHIRNLYFSVTLNNFYLEPFETKARAERQTKKKIAKILRTLPDSS